MAPSTQINVQINLLDAVVVGAGFAGISMLYDLRKFGFNFKVFEAGSAIGGVWHWNCYPGARVDSNYMLYQFHQPEIGFDFHWTERFPGWAELQAYFAHVDERHNFSKDIQFNTRVTGAVFNSTYNHWVVTTSDSGITHCRHLILCTGITSKLKIPNFPRMDKFCGEIYHTGDWTAERKVDFTNKRVAVIGTGPSGVQVIQEVAPIVAHLTVLQRTPNLAIPMRQKLRSDDWHFPNAVESAQIRDRSARSTTSLRLDPNGLNCCDATPEQREKLFEKLYNEGGFAFWRENFHDILFNLDANNHVYDYWRRKTLPRINDPLKRDILVPEIPPHPFGAKRPSLETNYFEVYNQPNVDIVNVKRNPISGLTEHGIRLENGDEVVADIIVMATGFDAVTGGIFDINIKNGSGKKLKDHWGNGIQTLIGMATPEFPNMWFLNGPHGTAALSTVALTAKLESEWLIQLLVWMRFNGRQRVVAKQDESEKWTTLVHQIWYETVFQYADSWYQGANIPGKKVEPLSYIGGTPGYVKALEEVTADKYASFEFI